MASDDAVEASPTPFEDAVRDAQTSTTLKKQLEELVEKANGLLEQSTKSSVETALEIGAALPLAAAAFLGVGGYAVASGDDELAETLRSTVGEAGSATLDAAGAAAEATAAAAAAEVKALPGRAADAARWTRAPATPSIAIGASHDATDGGAAGAEAAAG